LRSDSIRNVAGLDNSFLFLCFTTDTSHRSALSPPDLEVWPLTKNQTASAPIDAEIEFQASGYTPKRMYNSFIFQSQLDRRLYKHIMTNATATARAHARPLTVTEAAALAGTLSLGFGTSPVERMGLAPSSSVLCGEVG
jgi:hypothetical protein